MSEPITVTAVYYGGVFVPQADLSYLSDGTSVELQVPAPDEWDRLLEDIVAEEEADQATLHWTQSRWGDLSPDVARLVVDSNDLLVWNSPARREFSNLLL